MSLRELYNETTWKVYRLTRKASFWVCFVISVCAISAIAVLIIRADDIAYNRVMKSPNITNCTKFLDRYSSSEHVPEISEILKTLLIQKEEADFRKAWEANSLDECNKFLKEHPNSHFEPTIKGMIVDIKYHMAYQSDLVLDYKRFLQECPNSKYEKEINSMLKKKEDNFYKSYVNVSTSSLSRARLNEYLTLFPGGRYTTQVNNKLMLLDDEEAYRSASSTNTKYSWQQYLSKFPKGAHAAKARSKIAEFDEVERCRNNSLSNGSQPYARYYGSNYSYSWDRAAVKVNASAYSDVVVIVRYNNAQGSVAGHVYVRKGCSSTIYLLENRTYQVFFYYGSGWYPKKEMAGGVKGGFLERESFSKDGSSMYLRSGEIVTYTLTQQVHGNFSTSGSSENEVF